jgi:hypothetical protein
MMASSGKKKTTMAKLNRERRLRERRAEKEIRKQARREAAQSPAENEGPTPEAPDPPSGLTAPPS